MPFSASASALASKAGLFHAAAQRLAGLMRPETNAAAIAAEFCMKVLRSLSICLFDIQTQSRYT
jgi:hypothetical protein